VLNQIDISLLWLTKEEVKMPFKLIDEHTIAPLVFEDDIQPEKVPLNISVGTKYLITSEDPLNLILKEKYTKKNKTIGYKHIGYFSKLEHVCSFILEREIKSSDVQSLAELHTIILKTKEDILKALEA
jgi:hypothetical protein